MSTRIGLSVWLTISFVGLAQGADANRLTYLDELNPYYPSRSFPKLITPQWVGEEGVDAVVIFAIDDMRDPGKGTDIYEKFLRPILDRLKQIDGHAPLSIMTCQVKPDDPRLQQWLAEGLSLEVHTADHPCPLLQGGDFAKAKSTYDRCVDQLNAVPGNKPVAFRMPCCDSKNTPSPRFWAEIFNKTTGAGNFLKSDSSVFQLFTPNDPQLPRELVTEADGTERFRKYIPFPSFANTIEDYPCPYVIGNLCWEFPCVVPSDWESEHIQKSANPKLLEDWKAALDVTVLKQGTMTMVFHPYGWSSPQQHVALIDYAVSKYGKRVKFLNFREAVERLEKNVLGGQSLRDAKGGDNGVRLLDVNNDGYIDAVIGNQQVRQTRLWSTQRHQWSTSKFPLAVSPGVQFGILRPDGNASVLECDARNPVAWHFDGSAWVSDPQLLNGLDRAVATAKAGRDNGLRLRDLDGDGRCELIVGNDKENAAYSWSDKDRSWHGLPFALPPGTSIVDADGRDAGLRFVDIDGDGFVDVLFANDDHYSLHLFHSMQDGWSQQVKSGKRGDHDQIPPIVRNGTNNGAWFLHRTLWVQNEDTTPLPDQVDRRTFNELLQDIDLPARAPRSPQAGLNSLVLRAGFRAELAAAEPLVEDPIAIAWDAKGRLWVVEMSDYPLGIDGKGKPGGRVKILEDNNGDGHYTKSTLFLDHLAFPTGIMPWGKGVLITDAPNILYAEDTKGTGKADVVKVLYSGFVEGNQQHRVNGLRYGLDNWVYGANGHSGGHIKSFNSDKSLDIGGRDIRLKPNEGVIETTTGITQYGRTMNDWGDWFGCDNSNPMFQFVLDEHYLRRNPHYAPPQPSIPVSDDPGTAPVYPISPDMPRFNDLFALHRFTSANSVIVYRDDLFGPHFYGNSFVSEPVGNLVHREILRQEGVQYHSARAPDEQKSEFLASFDGWCRPTMLRVGPDGALWVVDMYRLVIEHPEWIPREWQEKLDLRAGHDKGRIYRIYPVGVKPRKIPRLGDLDAAGLVAALDTPSGWQRDFAQQLLVEREDPASVPLLIKAATDADRDVTRLHALCTLDGLGALTPDLLLTALRDRQPGVRRHAVRLCEPFFKDHPDLGEAVAKLADDPEPQVRMQVAYSLGEWHDARAGQALGALAVTGNDPYIEAAAMTSLTKDNLDSVIRSAVARASGAVPQRLLSGLIRFANAVRDSDAVSHLVEEVTKTRDGKYSAGQFKTVAALLDSLDSAKTPPSEAVAKRLEAVFTAARATADDDQIPAEQRVAAIRVLGHDAAHKAHDTEALRVLLRPQVPPEAQASAVAGLARMENPDTPRLLLDGWKTYSPALRGEVLDALLSRGEWHGQLLDQVEHKVILPADFDAVRRTRLIQSDDANVRKRAEALFAEVIKPDRQKVVDQFADALKLTGNTTHGAELFAKTCTTCHHFGGTGNPVGPDLGSIGDKSPETLLVSILDPNRAVEPKYVAYVVEATDGRTLVGVLGTETANSVTLLQPSTPPLQILRTEIKSVRSTGQSLMPEGLETGMSPQDVADLIAHIRTNGPQPQRRTFDGNKPELVVAADGGALRLTAANAEIYGSNVTFEGRFGNLGFWRSEDDTAAWTIQPARAGKYDVWIDYACDPSVAGNLFQLRAGTHLLTGKVKSTDSWDGYQKIKIGTIPLDAGRHRVTFRSEGRIHGYLIDLRGIELVPVAEKP